MTLHWLTALQAICNGSASDDAVCCDDDEGSVSVMACAVQVGDDARGSMNAFQIVCDDAVQNIELLRAVCCSTNKAVKVTCDCTGGGGGGDCLMMMPTHSQGVVQQAMGQVIALLLQCSVLTADQQQEIYADTDTLLDEECV